MGSEEGTCGRGDALRRFGLGSMARRQEEIVARIARSRCRRMRGWRRGNGEFGFVSSKKVRGGRGSGDGEAMEGFLRLGGGFVLILPIVAIQPEGERVLRAFQRKSKMCGG